MARSKVAPAQLSGFNSLPEEILSYIVLETYAPQAGEWRAWSTSRQTTRLAWLAASIPISRPWASQVYPILYNTVDIVQHWRAVSLLRGIKRRPLLAGLVRHLSVAPSRNEPAAPTTSRSWWKLPFLQDRALTSARRKYWQIYDELLQLCSAVTSCRTTQLDWGLLALYLQPTALYIVDIEDSVNFTGFTQIRTLDLLGNGTPDAVQFSDCSGFQWHLHTLRLQDMAVSGNDLVRLLSGLRPELRVLRCYGLQVTDAQEAVPFHNWIVPVRDTLHEFCYDGGYSRPISFHMLSNVAYLLVDIAAIYGTRPEEYLPRAVRHLQLISTRNVVIGDEAIFLCAEKALRIIKADRIALPSLQALTMRFAVHNSPDRATWKLLSFPLKETAQRHGIKFSFFAVISSWHDSDDDSFEWWDPAGHLASRGRWNRILDRSIKFSRKLVGKSPV